METTADKLRKYASATPSKWREEAEFRRENFSLETISKIESALQPQLLPIDK